MDPESDAEAPKRSGTLKKTDSVKRNMPKRSRANSARNGPNLGDPHSRNSFIYTPVPTQSNPTEILVNRFQAWRKVLKDYISYFREVQAQYEARGRGIHKVTQSLNAATRPSEFVTQGGIMETNSVLSDFHKEATMNASHAAKIESEIINNLTGLRGDLNLKIKEIKALSGDFRSNVEKEMEATKKEVLRLQEALETLDSNPSGGKDPYIVKLAVDKQLKRQFAEENYIHRAYLNLESSGRELEKIVVGEIQKAYATYVKILTGDGQELIDFALRLTTTTLRLPADREWNAFVERETHMVNPAIPMRAIDEIEYPGHHHPAVTEVLSGMLERKSKYLKSFTPAWYILSPTHLHEFKTPDRERDQTPVMSLYLPESSLGKYSEPSATSHKFVLKARQTGTLHRGHSWVFRAESHETMLEWYEAIKKLNEVSGAERNAYVRSAAAHKRSDSHDSQSYLSDNGLENDEADEVPYSGRASEMEYQVENHEDLQLPKRPEAGRFPSDIQVNRGLEHRESISGGSINCFVAAGLAQPQARKPVQVPRATGFGIDPITGEPESEFGPSRDSNSPTHIDFLSADRPVRASPESDPREPIPPNEADPVAMHSGSLAAVAEAPPLTAEALVPLSPVIAPAAAVVDESVPTSGAPLNTAGYASKTGFPILNQANTDDRPHLHRQYSNKGTISDLDVPGKYPNKV
ncbi:PH domain protein [Sphaerosporella brunnea]|uniref:PH domain protein n=1 Tax=Sphaerosporella brunnea TaxID=1250544 RepID=A0A5J5EC98_9PEZI|nr:PH domain protein [Sphaerosporella brunnea]